MKSTLPLRVVGESQGSAYNGKVTVTLPKTDSHFVVNVDYEGYLKIYEALAPNRIRLTYDGGRLELMSPSPELQHFVDRGKEIITSKLIREVQAWAREKKSADD